ncbi:MAG TPA: hypothetical protein PLK31_21890, partial [Chloroflexota bacterium]|nr:hypothetical protein [Chloroflexota bacterium]
DIQQNGLTWTSGLSLAADVAGLALPVVTGGGAAVRAIAHGDDISDMLRMAGHLGDGAQALTAVAKLKSVGSHSDEGIKLIKEIAEQGTKGDLKAGARVSLGHYDDIAGSPGYVKWAKNNADSVYLSVDQAAYDMLKESGQWWDVNRQFLDDAIAAGAEFHLQFPGAINPKSYFQQEIDYLIGKGYQMVEEGGEFWLRQ